MYNKNNKQQVEFWNMMQIRVQHLIKYCFYYAVIAIFFVSAKTDAQTLPADKIDSTEFLKGKDYDVYGNSKRFIENIGQYGDVYDKYPEMGNILYAYEGFNVPILFTPKGLIFLHRKIKKPALSEQEREEREKKKKKKEEEIEELKVVDRSISMEWINANPNVQIAVSDKTEEYHT
ncbi:MAG TPA: hypothetical protein PLF48_04565, partial [Chitinophagales bacterium]|nr:hypothetical protein [Chitinophagales bacterium]